METCVLGVRSGLRCIKSSDDNKDAAAATSPALRGWARQHSAATRRCTVAIINSILNSEAGAEAAYIVCQPLLHCNRAARGELTECGNLHRGEIGRLLGRCCRLVLDSLDVTKVAPT